MKTMFELAPLLDKLNKRWQRYEFHRAWLCGELDFPLTLPVAKVSGKQLLHDFSALQMQLARLYDACRKKDLILLEQEFQFASMGRQRLPVAVQVSTMDILLRLLGQQAAWRGFLEDVALLRESYPQLESWLTAQTALIVRHHGEWPQLLAVCRYFQQHPRPMRYLRQLDIAGVDSKFIESHKTVLKIVFDALLPPAAIDEAITTFAQSGFERRYGVCYEPPAVRFRLLDEALAQHTGGLLDITVPVEQFARLHLPVTQVVITENKINFLTLPPLKQSLAIFGVGFGVQLLKQIPWLERVAILYWGDIDTNGLAILSQLRGYFPQVQSILMSEDILLACRAMWVEEPADKVCAAITLPGLHPSEQELYEKLKHNVWQNGVRLEQERIPYSWVEQALLKAGLVTTS